MDIYIQEIPEAVREAVERLDCVLTTQPADPDEDKKD
jgi:hypothetical protein